MNIKVAIVDDHNVVIEGLEKIIAESDNVLLMDKAYSVAGCIKMLIKAQPDVLLLDVGLPDGSGMDLCPRIKGNVSGSKHPDADMLCRIYRYLARPQQWCFRLYPEKRHARRNHRRHLHGSLRQTISK